MADTLAEWRNLAIRDGSGNNYNDPFQPGNTTYDLIVP
jgi:hypothetical protein